MCKVMSKSKEKDRKKNDTYIRKLFYIEEEEEEIKRQCKTKKFLSDIVTKHK